MRRWLRLVGETAPRSHRPKVPGASRRSASIPAWLRPLASRASLMVTIRVYHLTMPTASCTLRVVAGAWREPPPTVETPRIRRHPVADSTDRPPRVSRFDLTLWARMAREAEQAARTEDAPTAFGIVSALASYLDQALTVCAHRWVTSMCWKPVCANCGDTGPRQLKLAKPTGEQIWDDDYRAT